MMGIPRAIPLVVAWLATACAGQSRSDLREGTDGGSGGSATGGAVGTGGANAAGTAGGPLNTDCTNEKGCGPRPYRCLSPGEPRCGGPAPRPDECASDLDCNEGNLLTICEPIDYCGRRICVPGCQEDEDCESSHACAPDGRCAPKACTSNSDCDRNHHCGNDVCNRSTCKNDVDCANFCVNGLCYPERGLCVNGELS